MKEPREADSVAARLRFLRGRLGLSQEQLARRLGVSFATVNRWESGRTQLSPRALRAIADLEAELAPAGPAAPAVPAPAAARPAAPASAAPAGLPLAQTSFIGRERELTELAAVIAESRLVSLIGPGGAGKSAWNRQVPV